MSDCWAVCAKREWAVAERDTVKGRNMSICGTDPRHDESVALLAPQWLPSLLESAGEARQFSLGVLYDSERQKI